MICLVTWPVKTYPRIWSAWGDMNWLLHRPENVQKYHNIGSFIYINDLYSKKVVNLSPLISILINYIYIQQIQLFHVLPPLVFSKSKCGGKRYPTLQNKSLKDIKFWQWPKAVFDKLFVFIKFPLVELSGVNGFIPMADKVDSMVVRKSLKICASTIKMGVSRKYECEQI